MTRAEDEAHMRHAIAASAQALEEGNVPFGAALVKEGKLEHVSRNDQITAGDPLGHAETVLVREVVNTRGRALLENSTVYASGEPCAMCTGAMFWAGISRIVYAASQRDIIEALGGSTLPIRSAEVLAGSQPPVQVDGPVLAAEAVAVLRRFGKSRFRP
jgi:tRNA(Arg) A34 adenosine deaminase TadA